MAGQRRRVFIDRQKRQLLPTKQRCCIGQEPLVGCVAKETWFDPIYGAQMKVGATMMPLVTAGLCSWSGLRPAIRQ